MKLEAEFNTKISGILKTLSRFVFFRKLSDKYQVGLSDFLIICNGYTVFLENKFLVHTTKALSHPFSKPQLSFFKQIELAGSKGYGLIGFGDKREMLLLRYNQIPESGNFTDLITLSDNLKDQVFLLNKEGVIDMLIYIFGAENISKGCLLVN